MVILFLFSILSLFWQSLIFTPLFLLVVLLVNYRQWLLKTLLILGFLADLFWVWPLGTGVLIYGLFVLIIYLYSKKYNYYNFIFLFTTLFAYSLLIIKITGQSVSVWQFLVFLLLFSLLGHQVKPGLIHVDKPGLIHVDKPGLILK